MTDDYIAPQRAVERMSPVQAGRPINPDRQRKKEESSRRRSRRTVAIVEPGVPVELYTTVDKKTAGGAPSGQAVDVRL